MTSCKLNPASLLGSVARKCVALNCESVLAILAFILSHSRRELTKYQLSYCHHLCLYNRHILAALAEIHHSPINVGSGLMAYLRAKSAFCQVSGAPGTETGRLESRDLGLPRVSAVFRGNQTPTRESF